MTRVENRPRRKHERGPDPSSKGPISEGAEHAKRGTRLQTAHNQQSRHWNTHLRAFPSRFNRAVCRQPSPAGPVGQGREEGGPTGCCQLAVGSSRSGARGPSSPQAALQSPGRSHAAACGFPSCTAPAASGRWPTAPVQQDGVSWWSSTTGIQSPGTPRSPHFRQSLEEEIGAQRQNACSKPTLHPGDIKLQEALLRFPTWPTDSISFALVTVHGSQGRCQAESPGQPLQPHWPQRAGGGQDTLSQGTSQHLRAASTSSLPQPVQPEPMWNQNRVGRTHSAFPHHTHTQALCCAQSVKRASCFVTPCQTPPRPVHHWILLPTPLAFIIQLFWGGVFFVLRDGGEGITYYFHFLTGRYWHQGRTTKLKDGKRCASFSAVWTLDYTKYPHAHIQ